jgi:hypothetical protein
MAKGDYVSKIMKNYFRYQVAIVEVRPGEKTEDAWRRHIVQKPADAGAWIKIFNQPGKLTDIDRQSADT